MTHSILSTPRSSSSTLHEVGALALRPVLSEALEQEIARDELRTEKYGGDDPREPAADTIPPTPEEGDPNLVSWDGTDDPANPQNWSVKYKWAVTVVCSFLTVCVTFASSAPTSATLLIAEHFHTSMEVVNLVTTCFLLGYVFGPFFWGPGSELLGRRPIFIGAFTAFTLLHLGEALAHNMQTLLVSRFLGGFFAVAPMTTCGGIIADIWDPVGRGLSTSMFSASVFIGPVMGPIIASFVSESYLGWRWVFWLMMIFSGACCILGIVFLPETYAPVLLAKKAKRLRKEDPEKYKDLYAEQDRQDWSFKGLMHRTLLRPFHMLAMEPILVLVTVYLAVVYGVLYSLFEALPVIFITRRGFTISQNGLIFIGVGIGAILGSLLNLYFTRHYPTLIVKWHGFPPPEQRLFGAMFAGPCLVIGAFWLGWTGEYAAVPWYVPAMSMVLIGLSVNLVFMSFLSYLVDTYLMYSASAFAANTVVRSAVAAAFPLFTVQMFTNLGVNWAGTLIGFVSLALAPSPFLFYKYGAKIRSRSKFAPCIDLKIAAELEAQKEKGQV
ncbi:MFS general substrate transporter [Neolentinus lepideus HHB14362 ss-1]|uniref:MFS general substrate transporter n=1 Tax=Neolentinus lepideus HHB14362 ss-1 TaxID=1314782 RepID=A0A165SQZ9_9AGAM|nr:MFS general substrate transporter [Neolentinus lepideus HHB14362 ss-1]